MKIKHTFAVREIAGDYILVPVGESALEFSGLITTNEVGAFIWKQLSEGIEKTEVMERVVSEFDVDADTARDDIDAFIQQLEQLNILDP